MYVQTSATGIMIAEFVKMNARWKKMAIVNVSKSTNIMFSEEEKQKIKEVYDLFYLIRHDLFVKDDDSEIYWVLDSIVDGINQIMK